MKEEDNKGSMSGLECTTVVVESITPIFQTSDLESSRDFYCLLGFTIESGSSSHAVLTYPCTPTTLLSAPLSSTIPASATTTRTTTPYSIKLVSGDPDRNGTIVLKLAGQTGIQSFRDALRERLNFGDADIHVEEIQSVGWFRHKFVVVSDRGERVVYEQDKPVYQS